jgi:hypothetical protein
LVDGEWLMVDGRRDSDGRFHEQGFRVSGYQPATLNHQPPSLIREGVFRWFFQRGGWNWCRDWSGEGRALFPLRPHHPAEQQGQQQAGGESCGA